MPLGEHYLRHQEWHREDLMPQFPYLFHFQLFLHQYGGERQRLL